MHKKPKKIQVESGYYFSPGFYMNYWLNCIEKYYSSDVIKSHVKLKIHREVWTGAILAAWQTKVNGIKHYVGVPEREPPDVEVVRFIPTTGPKGGDGTNMQKVGFEITRCSMDEGETLIEQIKKKNKPAYSGMSLVVYVYGGIATDFNRLHEEVIGLGKIYPIEIIVAGPVIGTETTTFEPGTFGITKIYPQKGQDTVNLFDKQAFFMHSNVRAVTGRGVTRKLKDLGYIELMPPEIEI